VKPATRNATVRLTITAAVASLTLTLAGCFAPGQVTSTPTGEKVDAALAPYYSQILTWVECGDGAECTTVRVPRDWDNPLTITDISLSLARHRATGTALGSLFVNPGGPGASGYDLVHDDVDYAASEKVLANYDVIGWDPRGVGRSTPVTCYDDAKLDEFIYGLPDAPRDSAAWNEQVVASATAFGKACLDKTGPVLQFVDTQSTVRDLDLMRALVGDEKLNYLGYSYGSDIGMFYIDRFPEKVGRVVLDGATDSTVTSFDVSLTQSVGFERALTAYLEACPGLGECPFSGDLPADLATVHGLYESLDASPIAAADGRLMDGGVLDVAMSMGLYSEESWPEVSVLFTEALAGETEQAFYLADYYYSRGDDGTYIDNSLEAFIAISCVDYPAETDLAVIAQQNADLVAAAPTTARPSAIGDPVCANWPFQYRGGDVTAVTGAGADPVLIVSTTGDPATPYEWGVALSEQLESAQLVTFNGEGHTAYNQGTECVDSAVDDYLIEGTVPSSDPDC
jgi:pimeloyl-ACP methyl ester carboxylesterase